MFDPEDEGATIIRNVGKYLPDTTFNIPEGWIFSVRLVPGPGTFLFFHNENL